VLCPVDLVRATAGKRAGKIDETFRAGGCGLRASSIAGVLTVATIVVARLSLRSLEQRAEVAFPDERAGSVAQPQPVGN
jgi:hypothetical protein